MSENKERMKLVKKKKEQMRVQYGLNKNTTDGNYDELLVVKCTNGVFVGKKTENIIAYNR